MAIPIDVAEHIRAAFPPEQQDAALGLLESAVLHDGTTPDARLLRCAAMASRGDLRRLKGYVVDLHIDYRNVIVEGEYDVIDGKLIRVRNLSEPIPPSA
jgi:hypothetical protein